MPDRRAAKQRLSDGVMILLHLFAVNGCRASTYDPVRGGLPGRGGVFQAAAE